MASYEYKPLNEGEIRVLRLHPAAAKDARLEASLEPYRLDPGSIPGSGHGQNYEAVSYAWGTSPDRYDIFIDGGLLRITPSLRSLLNRLRDESESRLLWADAICINQSDPVERGSQVALMARIYSTADRVVIDLGEETEDVAPALELIDAFWRKYLPRGIPTPSVDMAGETMAYYVGVTLPTGADAEKFMAAELPPAGDPRWDAVAQFFDRPWFSRVWIIQEFILARDPVMYVGTRRVEWTHLLAATFKYHDIGTVPVRPALMESVTRMMTWSCVGVLRRIRVISQTEEGRRFLETVTPQSHLWKKFQNCRLVDLLHYFQMSNATEPRDRFFSTLGMADDIRGDEPELAPDYLCPIETVVTRVARFLVTRKYGEEMVMRAGLVRQPRPGMPSWAEDVTVTQGAVAVLDRSLEDNADNAAGGTSFVSRLSPSPDNILTVLGCKFDTVCTRPFQMSMELSITDPSKSIAYLREWTGKAFRLFLQDTTPGQLYPTGEPIFEAAMRALICDQRQYRETPREMEVGFTTLAWICVTRNRDFLGPMRWAGRRANKLFDVGFEDIVKHIDAFIKHAMETLLKKLIPAVTRRGYYAHLPACFEPGDQIWIVRGCRQPLLLRRSDERPGTYRLVGSCYVHGIMEGEGLQGREMEEVSIH